MSDFFLLKAIGKLIILPPVGLLLIVLSGLFLVGRHPRTGRAIATIAVVYLLALSTPIVSYKLSQLLDTAPPLDLNKAVDAQAIVILGGGVRRHAVEYGGDTLSGSTLERVRYGAGIAKHTGLPVLVAGGSTLGGEAEARLMRKSLESEFGVRVRWSEDQSKNTHDSAKFSAAILAQDKINRVALVTHGAHMPRATMEFVASGLSVIAAPTEIPSGDLEWPLDYLPSVSGLQGSYIVCHELLAKLVTRVRSIW
ncbi:MAG: YdcF family protein [Candidatus Nitrotoga sp.]